MQQIKLLMIIFTMNLNIDNSRVARFMFLFPIREVVADKRIERNY